MTLRLPSADAQEVRSASADRRARIGTPNAWGRPPGPWWPRAGGLVRAAAGHPAGCSRHPDGRTADAPPVRQQGHARLPGPRPRAVSQPRRSPNSKAPTDPLDEDRR
jgi:hypothetical protein